MDMQPFIDYRTSYDIAGKSDFILPSEVEAALNFSYTAEALEHFQKTLPPKEELDWCKERDFVFIPGPPEIFSMEKIVAFKPELFHFGDARDKETCAWYSLETRWIIIKKSILLSDRHHAAIEHISENTEALGHDTPSPTVLAWSMLTYYMIRNKFLFEGCNIMSSAIKPASVSTPITFQWAKTREDKKDVIYITDIGANSISMDCVICRWTDPLVPFPKRRSFW